MSRAAFYDALIGDSQLNQLGITEDTVFHNWSSEERPTDVGPFVILRWEDEGKPVWGSEAHRGARGLTMWVHFPNELTTDFNRVTSVLNRVDDLVTGLRDVAGSDGYTLSFVQCAGRSADLIDEGFNTVTRTGSYSIHQMRSVATVSPDPDPDPDPGVTVPDPVSHFDWHEGSGPITISLVGGYALAVDDWTTHNGQGAIGPNSTITNWTLALDVTVTTLSYSALLIDNGIVFYNVDTAGHIGIYPNLSTGSIVLTTGVSHRVVFVVSGGNLVESYIDGVLAGSHSGGNLTMNPGYGTFKTMRDTHPTGQNHRLRFWDKALSSEQVAAL